MPIPENICVYFPNLEQVCPGISKQINDYREQARKGLPLHSEEANSSAVQKVIERVVREEY